MRLGVRPIVGLFALATLLTACGGGGATAAPSAAPSGSAAASVDLGTATSDQALCTKPTAASGTTLTIASYGGAYQKAQRTGWFNPYAAATGAKFVESEDSANATIKAQVDSGQVTWDAVDVGNDFGLDANASLLEPLDYSKIPGTEVLPGFAGKYRVADITYGVVLAYRTDKFNGAVPQGWADFFDLTKFPGKRGLWDYSTGGVLEFALMADGVKPKDLYPLDVPRALKKLDTIKDSIVWWDTGAKSQEMIGSGEVAMSMMWNGRAWSAKNTDNKPVDIQWNQQILTADYWVVPKGTANKDAAMDFIAWTICKQNNAAPSDAIPYGPTNKLAQPNPAKVKDLAASNINDTTAYFNDQWLIDNTATLDDQFNAWKTK